MFLKSILHPLSYYLFPPCCLKCSFILPFNQKNHDFAGNLLCEQCRIYFTEYIRLSHGKKRCEICSRILVSEIGICTSCRQRNYSFQRNISLWEYSSDYARLLIHSYKFRNNRQAAFFLAESVFRVYMEHFSGVPLVPAPCSRKRLKKYGWDHMKYLSMILGKIYGIKTFSLLKKLPGRDQKELDFDERNKGLENRIIINDKKADKYITIHESVVLLDDVFTTGATADYCTRLLISAGFKKVSIITLALD